MNVLDVVMMGNPLLRELSIEVKEEEIKTEKFQNDIDDLIATMRSEHGAGIAAPQVGVLKRYFIIEVNNNPRYPDKDSFELLVAINPIITPIRMDQVDSWEGCLSIPNIRGQLRRFESVTLSALDRHGEKYSLDLKGFPAIVAQHELDHLDGILYIDRMTDMTSLSFYSEYLKRFPTQ